MDILHKGLSELSPGYAIAEWGCLFCVCLFNRYWPISRLGVRVFLQPSFATTRTEIRMVNIIQDIMNSENSIILVGVIHQMATREAEYGRRGRDWQATVLIFIYQQALATSTLAVSTGFFIHGCWKHNPLHTLRSFAQNLTQCQITACACSR